LSVLYIVSAEEAAGKTAICAGIAINLQNAGKKVGYLKPEAAEKGQTDGDIGFMRKVLGLTDIVNAPDLIKGRDIVLVEAKLGEKAGDAVSKATYAATKDMKARVIAVEIYAGQTPKFASVYKGFGDSFLGVVINKVPPSQLMRVKEEATARFGAEGITLLGAIPENRVLLAITVGELAESVRGKILNSTEKSGELVENYMLGALVVDSGLDYFGRKSAKAAVIRQDRPDMQLAALETPTSCLVLGGSSQPPVYSVLHKAESKSIPIITTETAVSDIVTSIENALAKSRFNQEKKLKKLAEIVKQNLDMKALG
jgi:BioD-like phosphotransacetylase family protein